ncbi:MAG: phage-shock protein [Bacillota bacterium]
MRNSNVKYFHQMNLKEGGFVNGRLYSLTDVLKRTLYFFEALSVKEVAPYVRRKMLRDLSLREVEEKVELCLKQHTCFNLDNKNQWHLNTEGFRGNDAFYHLLLKRQQPLSMWELRREEKGKKNKAKKVITEAANLISDGRFVQLDTGMWGLTEWDLDAGQYPLKYLVLKILRAHPAGLSLNQIVEALNLWRPIAIQAVEGVLRRFPFFEQQGETWSYSATAQTAYDAVMRRFLGLLREQKQRHGAERTAWQKKFLAQRIQLNEIIAAQQQTAAALAAHAHYRDECDRINTQLSEKELLLTLRKRELVYYREQMKKIENKAQSILHQCRLWVGRARESEKEIANYEGVVQELKGIISGLEAELGRERDKEREARAKLAETREQYGTQVARLQREVIDMKQKLEQCAIRTTENERRLLSENARLSNELQKTTNAGQELERDYRFLHQELNRLREEHRQLERRLRNPLVRLVTRISWFLAK